jgi:hypothetical protein
MAKLPKKPRTMMMMYRMVRITFQWCGILGTVPKSIKIRLKIMILLWRAVYTPIDLQTSQVYSTTLVQDLYYISCYLFSNKRVLSYLLLRLLPQYLRMKNNLIVKEWHSKVGRESDHWFTSHTRRWAYYTLLVTFCENDMLLFPSCIILIFLERNG